jgi:hypothetical protein
MRPKLPTCLTSRRAQRASTLRSDPLITALIPFVILFILPFWGPLVMAAGSVVALIYFGLTIDFKPGPLDPRGTLVKAGLTFLIVALSLVVIFMIVQSLFR